MSTYVTSSPLLRGVRILQRNRVTEGVRLARRARLTYLKEINPNVYTVDDSTKDASVRLEEKEEKRRLAKSGRKLAKETKRSGGGLEEEGGLLAALACVQRGACGGIVLAGADRASTVAVLEALQGIAARADAAAARVWPLAEGCE